MLFAKNTTDNSSSIAEIHLSLLLNEYDYNLFVNLNRISTIVNLHNDLFGKYVSVYVQITYDVQA